MKNKKVYTPDGIYGGGVLKSWKEMVLELFAGKELVWTFFIRNFNARYKQSVLGVLWAVIMPVVMVLTFLFLNRSGIINIGETGVPYAVFALVGLTIWQLFATGVSGCTNSLVESGSTIIKINFPKESLVIAFMAQSVLEFLIRTVFIIAIFLYYGMMPSWTTLFLPFTLLPIALLAIGLGFILSLANAVIRDTSNIIAVLLNCLLFLMPVLYPLSGTGMMVSFNRYNPLYYLLESSRGIVIYGKIGHPAGFLVSCLISMFVFIFAWRIFHRVESKMAERV